MQFPDGKGLLSFALFRADWNDQQVLSYVNGQSHVANSQRSRSQGGEIELTVIPTAGLTLSGGFGYNDAKFIRFDNADFLGNSGDGKRQPRAARYTGFAGLKFERALSDGGTGCGRRQEDGRVGQE